MHIHIVGICGTFMGGVAQLARSAGHKVSGSDQNVYPPMDAQLRRVGIDLMQGYSANNLKPVPDLVIIGNALSRGNEEIEHILASGLRYTSGAQWLCDEYLQGKWVLAVAGTHGKTTTASMLAWILDYAGLNPGFLIGGVPNNFACSARAGETDFFVVEADEYDTAFFDKRSKFVHYRPRTLVLNNLEFDHADIFEDLAAIKKQFHHLVRTVPGNGLIVVNGGDVHLQEMLQTGCWTPTESLCRAGATDPGASAADASGADASGAGDWLFGFTDDKARSGKLVCPQGESHLLSESLLGLHNLSNACAAIAAARHAGVPVKHSVAALAEFTGVKRRLEQLDTVGGVRVYDDFAHHPTAIAATLAALRPECEGKLIALLDFRSNSMVAGTHIDAIASALNEADLSLLFNAQPDKLDLTGVCADVRADSADFSCVQSLLDHLAREVRPGDTVVCMSNGSFEAIHGQLLTMLGS